MLQLPLGVRLRDASRFESYRAGSNAAAVHALQSIAATAGGARVIWLWGAGGSGRTHLLQAVCSAAGAEDRGSAYVPLAEVAGIGPGLLGGFERLAVIALDDVERVAGDERWEEALFSLYNAVVENGAALVAAASVPPAAAGWRLRDLASRFSAATVFHLRTPEGADLVAALQQRASLRGLELPADSAEFLLRRYPRDMHTLCAVLETLDVASLVAQRRLTVPFLKEVLERRQWVADPEL
jgi:DnaA family protein